MGAFRRSKKTPAQQNLERELLWAAARLGRHYGRHAAHMAVKELVRQLQNPESPVSQVIDDQHNKEVQNG